MYRRHELYSTLSAEEITRTLQTSGLPEKEEYTEDEADRFRYCRSLIEQGKTDLEIAQLLQSHGVELTTEADSTTSQTIKKSKNSKKLASQPQDISQLLSIASKLVGEKISLTQAMQILQASGLPDSCEYDPAQCERFLEACDLIKRQGKSFEEVAEHFGLKSLASDSDISCDIEEVAAVLQHNDIGVVDEMMRTKATVDASAAGSLYLKHLANEFGSPQFQQAWKQMEQALKAKIVGKSRRQTFGEVQAIPPSTAPLNILPEASDNS